MKIEKNYNLSKLNTFGIGARAKFFAEVGTEAELQELFHTPEFEENKKIFLGGGSNVLLTRDWEGIAILNKLRGIEILEDNGGRVVLRAMGGENWHNLVEFASARGYWGIENLSLIPGSVGAAPMQNIGAYGAELKDTLLAVEAYEIASGKKRIFTKEECALGYRDSIFKNELKGQYFIFAVTFKLKKSGQPNTEYKILRAYLEKHNITPKNPKDISDAVAAIRRSKLPDPKIIGNVGSFFKNVFVDESKLEELKKKYPDISYFEDPADAKVLAGRDGRIKIPAAWLIERAGPSTELGTSWKGYRRGNVGVHEKQALVLVNYGGATGAELLRLAEDIIASIREKFGLTLVPEVNIV